MRKRLYEIIEADDPADGIDLPSTIYDIFMLVTITISILPLAFKDHRPIFDTFEKIAFVVFLLDYLLRWATADYKYGKRAPSSFLRYPFSTMAVIDLASILPSIVVVSEALRLLRVMRMLRAFRVFKAFRYSSVVRSLREVLRESRQALTAVFALAVGYILVSALAIFTVEPDSFTDFYEAVYWATVSLTTVGYGDIYPVTILGRMVTMISSVVGIAIVALPSGIITAGYIKVLNRHMGPKGERVETLSALELAEDGNAKSVRS